MTTIATNGVTMSADTKAIGDEGIVYETKLVKHQGSLYGTSGNFNFSLKHLKKWADAGHDIDDVPSSVDILRVTSKGKIYIYSGGEFGKELMLNGCGSIGSGRHHALAAMHAGASPKKAVKISKRFDPYTGGKVETIKL